MSGETKSPAKQVAIVAFEGISLFHLSVPLAIFVDALAADEALAQNRYFEVNVYAENIGNIRAQGGLTIEVTKTINDMHDADIIIVPSWQIDVQPSPLLIESIQQGAAQGKLIVGLCLGAYVLAYAGLLDGKAATSHWKVASDFTHRFPKVHFDSNALYLIEDNIITSAGSAGAIDCCLHIFKRIYGVKIANHVARVMVSSPARMGGQNQYIEQPVVNRPSDERIASLVDTVLADLTLPMSIEQAANFCSMSVRTFTRHFKASFGSSFTKWHIMAKLNASLLLLESTELTITHISEQVGFSSEQIFRKHFKQVFDTTPQSWRKLFRSRD